MKIIYYQKRKWSYSFILGIELYHLIYSDKIHLYDQEIQEINEFYKNEYISLKNKFTGKNN